MWSHGRFFGRSVRFLHGWTNNASGFPRTGPPGPPPASRRASRKSPPPAMNPECGGGPIGDRGRRRPRLAASGGTGRENTVEGPHERRDRSRRGGPAPGRALAADPRGAVRAGDRSRRPGRRTVGRAVAVHRAGGARSAGAPHRGARLGPVRRPAGVVRCRFDFDAQAAMRPAEQLGASPAETLERVRRSVPSRTKPPLPVVAMLGEAVVHGQDVRRPPGIRREHPIGTLTRVAEYYSGSDQVVPAKGRLGGLRLTADDGPFETGTGRPVTGPAPAPVMAMTGRAAHCGALSGTASSRCARGARRDGPGPSAPEPRSGGAGTIAAGGGPEPSPAGAGGVLEQVGQLPGVALQIVLGVGDPVAEHRVDGGLEGDGHDPAVEVAEHALLLPPAEDVLQALVELLVAGDAVAP